MAEQRSGVGRVGREAHRRSDGRAAGLAAPVIPDHAVALDQRPLGQQRHERARHRAPAGSAAPARPIPSPRTPAPPRRPWHAPSPLRFDCAAHDGSSRLFVVRGACRQGVPETFPAGRATSDRQRPSSSGWPESPEAGGGLAEVVEGRFGVAGGARQVALDLVDGGVPGRLEQDHVRQQLGGFRVARGTVEVAGSRRRDRGRHDEADLARRARLCGAVERRLGLLDRGERRQGIRGGG